MSREMDRQPAEQGEFLITSFTREMRFVENSLVILSIGDRSVRCLFHSPLPSLFSVSSRIFNSKVFEERLNAAAKTEIRNLHPSIHFPR